MQQIESDEISDTGLGLIGNGVPERTLKFDFGESIFLGEDDDVVNTRRGVKCRWRWLFRESNGFVFNDCGRDIAKGVGEGNKLLVGNFAL